MEKDLNQAMEEYLSAVVKEIVAGEPNPNSTLFETFVRMDHCQRIYRDMIGEYDTLDIDPDEDDEEENVTPISES